MTGTLTVNDTETDLTMGNVTFDFESGPQGWTAFSGTFNRTNTPTAPGANAGFYMKSSTAVDDACDRARSPKVRLTATSTLSLSNRFITEAETPATPFYDRGNVGIINAQGQTRSSARAAAGCTTPLNTYTGCNTGPGWATTSPTARQPVGGEHLDPAALDAASSSARRSRSRSPTEPTP